MNIPFISASEKETALKHAREIRKARAEIKKGLKARKLVLAELLDKKNKYFAALKGMKVLELVRALPGFGAVKANELLHVLQISDKKKYSGLGHKQKARFLDYFKKF